MSNTSKTYFFAIHIAEKYVQSALWQVGPDGIDISTISARQNWQDEESCLNAIDVSMQELGKESENVTQTLFALESDWVDAQGILATKKPLFQRITKELSLEAVGFVVTPEAVLQHITQTVSPQMSLFFVEVTSTQIVLTLVKQGKATQIERVGRSGNTISDFTEAFAHFKEKTFPAKLLLFSTYLDTEELEDLRQELFGHDWPSHYPFLHPPMVDVYPADDVVEMVVRTGGQAVAGTKGIPVAAAVTEERAETSEPQESEEEVENGEPVASVEADEKLNKLDAEDGEWESTFQSPDFTKSSATHATADKKKQLPLPSFAGLTKGLQNIRLPKHFHPDNHLLFAGIGVLAGVLFLLLATMVSASTMVKTYVLVELNTKPITKETTFTLDSKIAANDLNNQLLKAQVVTKEVSGQKSSNTTGNKLIGEKAKGKVTLFNRTSSSKTFAAGTTLNSGKLKYVLDGQVTVASASTGTNFETKPGTAEANITAVAIGTESNLGKNVDMTVESYGQDTYVARTATEITGGTSREIQAVSKEDREKLLAELKKELTDKAVEELKSESGGGKYVVPTSTVKVTTSKYSGEVGKETNSLSLDLTLQVEALSYFVDDLKPLALELLKKEVPAGYQLSDAEPQILSSPAQTASGSSRLKLETSLSATAIPQVNVDDWKQEVAGKTAAQAEETLKQKQEIKQVTLQRRPGILTVFAGKISKKLENIIIQVDQQ